MDDDPDAVRARTGDGRFFEMEYIGELSVTMEADGADGRASGVAMDGAASGGKYIAAPGAAKSQDPTASTMGIATYMFDIATAGAYTIYGRVEAQSQATNSFWVKMDGGAFIQWNNISSPMTTSWTWEAVHDTNDGDAVVRFSLNAGKHTLLIAYREPDTRLDALSISNDPKYTPMGTSQ